MDYGIKTMAQKAGLTEYTLRYYEREGLLPPVGRDENGRRRFSDRDLDWISLVCCLRDTGMSIAEIRRYIDLCKEGSSTVPDRRQLLIDHKAYIEKKIGQFERYARKIDGKIEYYHQIESSGEEDCCNPYNGT